MENIKKIEVEEKIIQGNIGEVKLNNFRIEQKISSSGNGYTIYFKNKGYCNIEILCDVLIKNQKYIGKLEAKFTQDGKQKGIMIDYNGRDALIRTGVADLCDFLYKEKEKEIINLKQEAEKHNEIEMQKIKEQGLFFKLSSKKEYKCDDSQTTFYFSPNNKEIFEEEIKKINKILEHKNLSFQKEIWRFEGDVTEFEFELCDKKFRVGDKISYNELLELLDSETTEREMLEIDMENAKKENDFKAEVKKVEVIGENKYKYENNLYEIQEGSYDHSFGDGDLDDETNWISYRRLYKNNEIVKIIPKVIIAKHRDRK